MKSAALVVCVTFLALCSLPAAAGDVRHTGPRLPGEPLSASTPLILTSYGHVDRLVPPNGFVLDDDRMYVVDSHTRLVGQLRSYDNIEIGAFLRVAAVRARGGYRALLVSWVGDVLHGDGYRVIDGVVRAVGENRLLLHGPTMLRLRPETRYLGDAERRDDLEPGWRVRVRALEIATGGLVALVVTADDLLPPTTRGHDFSPSEALLVTVDGTDLHALAGELGAEVVNQIPAVAVLMRWAQELDDELLARVAGHPQVVAVEPNYTFRDPESVRRRYPIVDRNASVQTFLHQSATSTINLTDAGQGAPDAGVVVAVLDTGVDPTHQVLRQHIVEGGLDLIDGDVQPWEHADGIDQDGDGDVDEAHGHGTFVASLVALVAPRARILPYRVLDADGGGSAFNVAVALADAIDRGVDVINLSFTYQDRSEVVDALLDKAAEHDVVVVAAAGNDDEGALPFPASDSHTIAVTALNTCGDALAPFANRAPEVRLAAPGEQLYGALPDGLLGTWEGTSFAAPLATGVAALLRLADPGIDAELVEQAILRGGRPVTSGEWDGAALDAAGALVLVE